MKIKKLNDERALTSRPSLAHDAVGPSILADTLLGILAIFVVIWMWNVTSLSVGY